MLGKLVDRYNDVVRMANAVATRADARDPKTSGDAKVKMAHDFPYIKKVGATWRIQGEAHGKTFNDPLARITVASPELIGLKDPQDLTKMNLVKRPKESE